MSSLSDVCNANLSKADPQFYIPPQSQERVNRPVAYMPQTNQFTYLQFWVYSYSAVIETGSGFSEVSIKWYVA